MSEVSDRVAMRFGEEAYRADLHTFPGEEYKMREVDWFAVRKIAAALSSHGLREMVEALTSIRPYEGCNARHFGLLHGDWQKIQRATALLGEPPTVKGEK